ncbi:MAG: response regulator [Deltaproteobacteria bacterium]|nr:response regulator [Deltaproteobacteria bacterium]
MKARILIADDEKIILDMLSDFMEGIGYHVDLAGSVDSALALMQTNEYDILLIDKNMPHSGDNKEGGMRLLKYAKEHNPLTEVILMTGDATVESAVEAMKLGAFDYVMKPIPLNELKGKIDRILEYKRFLSSENTLQMHKALHNQLLALLVNRNDIPEDKLQRILRTLGARIDQLFGMQKGYEGIIETQAEALEKIEGYADHLKEAIPGESPYYALIEKILEESRRRI